MNVKKTKSKILKICIIAILSVTFVGLAVIPFTHESRDHRSTLLSPVVPLYEIKDTIIPLPYSKGAVVIQRYYGFHLSVHDVSVFGIRVSREVYEVDDKDHENRQKVTDTETYRTILDEI